ncbi:MAG: hypothetical protein HYY18_09820 [Planctomycetes bacterium]|nr:hypothetical protein [Planctomycetota bacterium]
MPSDGQLVSGKGWSAGYLDFDTWEGETDRLLNSVARTDRDRLQDLLDRTAAASLMAVRVFSLA